MDDSKRTLMVRVTDILKDKHEKWLEKANGYFVLLKAGCGRGKTYYMLRVLLPYAIRQGMRVCIYVPRKTLYHKMLIDILSMRTDNLLSLEECEKLVTVRTYQELEIILKCGGAIPKVDINIVEEASYYLDDSTFSNSTILSYKYLSSGEGRAKLNFWISGTGDRIFKRLIADLKLRKNDCEDGERNNNRLGVSATCYSNAYEEVNLPGDYSWLDVKYLDNDFDICELIKTDVDSKWVVFLDSKTAGKKFYEQLKAKNESVVYLNADNIDSEQEVVNSIASIDKYEQRILLTTAVIESGNDFTELELRNVVVLCSTQDRFLQMVSRRRRQNETDSVRVFIPKRDIKYFERCLSDVMGRLETFVKSIYQKIGTVPTAMNKLMAAKESEWKKMMGFFGVTEEQLVINELLLDELIYLRDFYKDMCVRLREDEHAFIKKQLEWLGLSEQFSTDNYIRSEIINELLMEILEKVKEQEKIEPVLSAGDLGEFIGTLEPLVKKVKKSYVKEGIKRPKFVRFCLEFNLPCEFIEEMKDRKKYYRIQTGDWNSRDTKETEDRYHDEDELGD